MSSLAINVSGYVALLNFRAVGTPAFKKQRGFESFQKNGIGDWTFILSEEFNTDDINIMGLCESVVPNDLFVEIIDKKTIKVRTIDSGGPADINFWLSMQSIGPN